MSNNRKLNDGLRQSAQARTNDKLNAIYAVLEDVERDIRRLAEPLDLKHVQTRAGVGEKFLYGPKHKDTTKPTIQRRIEKINEKWEKLEPEPGENIEQSELDKAKLEAKYWEDRYRKLARHFNIWFHRMRDQSRVIRAKRAEFGNIRNFNHKR